LGLTFYYQYNTIDNMPINPLKTLGSHSRQTAHSIEKAVSKLSGQLGGHRVSSQKGSAAPLNTYKSKYATQTTAFKPGEKTSQVGKKSVLIGKTRDTAQSAAKGISAAPKQVKTASKPIIGEARAAAHSLGAKVEKSAAKLAEPLKSAVSEQVGPDVQKATGYTVDIRLENDQARQYHDVLRNTLVSYLNCSEDEARSLCNQAAAINQKMQDMEAKKAQGADLQQDRKALNQLKESFFQELQNKATQPYLDAIGTTKEAALEAIFENRPGSLFVVADMSKNLLASSLAKADSMMLFLGPELRQAIVQEQQQRSKH
jgi:hypothetical protein